MSPDGVDGVPLPPLEMGCYSIDRICIVKLVFYAVPYLK